SLGDDLSMPQTFSLGSSTMTWLQIGIVVNRLGDDGTIYIYRNGGLAQAYSYTNISSIGAADRFCVGDSVDFYRGKIDEVRMYLAQRSPEWFATEHANLTTRGTFMPIDPEESRP